MSWIQVLNCKNCNQCLNCYKSADLFCVAIMNIKIYAMKIKYTIKTNHSKSLCEVVVHIRVYWQRLQQPERQRVWFWRNAEGNNINANANLTQYLEMQFDAKVHKCNFQSKIHTSESLPLSESVSSSVSSSLVSLSWGLFDENIVASEYILYLLVISSSWNDFNT